MAADCRTTATERRRNDVVVDDCSSYVQALYKSIKQSVNQSAYVRQLIGSEWRQLSAGVCALDCAVPIS